MGRIGTDVAKECSNLILSDDNLKNIVLTIEYGRNIYLNL
jgi:magnesium-transporting ATPase (P-type)